MTEIYVEKNENKIDSYPGFDSPRELVNPVGVS